MASRLLLALMFGLVIAWGLWNVHHRFNPPPPEVRCVVPLYPVQFPHANWYREVPCED